MEFYELIPFILVFLGVVSLIFLYYIISYSIKNKEPEEKNNIEGVSIHHKDQSYNISKTFDDSISDFNDQDENRKLIDINDLYVWWVAFFVKNLFSSDRVYWPEWEILFSRREMFLEIQKTFNDAIVDGVLDITQSEYNKLFQQLMKADIDWFYKNLKDLIVNKQWIDKWYIAKEFVSSLVTKSLNSEFYLKQTIKDINELELLKKQYSISLKKRSKNIVLDGMDEKRIEEVREKIELDKQLRNKVWNDYEFLDIRDIDWTKTVYVKTKDIFSIKNKEVFDFYNQKWVKVILFV